MSDAGLIFVSIFILTIPKTFSLYSEETKMICSYILLMILSVLMGSHFFPQSYYEGILNIRGNFYWLSFFVYIALIKNIEHAVFVVKVLTLLFGIYTLILIVTKYFPNLGILQLPRNVYSKHSTLKRFGEVRLFFPYGSIPILFFFIALVQSINGYIKETFIAKTMRFSFMIIVCIAIVLSMTRAVIYPALISITFAFITSKKRSVKIAGIVLIVLFASYQILSISISTGEESLLDKTIIGKMIFKSTELAEEQGRKLQLNMYLTQFMRSPITGVGNFAVSRFVNQKDGGVLQSYKAFGFFNGSDMGYLKILAENGLVGIAWVLWWYFYFYRQGNKLLKVANKLGNIPFVETLVQGLQYFTVYLLFSGVTLAHFVHPRGITVLPLALALMAIARRTVNELAERAAKEAPPLFSRMESA
ncbi:MAG: O-antigen ligase family protein [Pedobacter sp.]